MPTHTHPDEVCSFCARGYDQVERLIAGPPGIYICNECVELCNSILEQEKTRTASRGVDLGRLPSPSEIKTELDAYVIGQERAKKILSVAVYNHYQRIKHGGELGDVEMEKSNVLLLGPTGSGKTLLARTLARVLNVPFAIGDATTLTEAGYVGEDVENLLLRLLQAADHDIEQAECGIIYLDEIDKIGRKSQNPSITRDVSGEGVQQALLKMLEGTVANIPPQGGRKHPEQKYIQMDTSQILFICGGSFEGIEEIVRNRLGRSAIGFRTDEPAKELVSAEAEKGEFLQRVDVDDLLGFGMIPEFVGRLPVICSLNPLDEEAMIRILTEPKNAIARQYEKAFELEGSELVINDEAMRVLAQRALKKHTGARALRGIMEEVMLDIMFELPSRRDIKKFVITPEVLENGFQFGPRPSIEVKEVKSEEKPEPRRRRRGSERKKESA